MLQNCASKRNQSKLRIVSPSLLKNASSIEWCRDAEEVSKVNSDLVNFVAHRLIQYLLHHHQSQGNYRDPLPKSQVKLENRFPTDWGKGGGRGANKQKRHIHFLTPTGGPNWPFRCLDLFFWQIVISFFYGFSKSGIVHFYYSLRIMEHGA